MQPKREWAIPEYLQFEHDLCTKFPEGNEGKLMLIERIAALAERNRVLVEAIKLAEHKIDQTLQGQYPEGQALGTALWELRAALANEPAPEQEETEMP